MPVRAELGVGTTAFAPNNYASYVRDQTPAQTERQRRSEELSLLGAQAIRDWEAGGDPAQAIGTLKSILAEDPERLCRYSLAHILQAEGRDSEAVDEYWRICHHPAGRNDVYNPEEGNIGVMVRIADALEDIGRTEDAAWAFGQTDEPNRRAAYLQATFTSSPPWRRKWMKKLLRENPNDKEAHEALERAEYRIAEDAKKPERRTRDVPRD